MEKILKALNEIGKQKDLRLDDMINFEDNGKTFTELANSKDKDLGLKKINPMNGLSTNKWYVWFKEEMGNFIYIGKPTNLSYPPTYNGFWKSNNMDGVCIAKDRLMSYLFRDVYEIPNSLSIEIEKIYNKLINNIL